MKLEYVKSKTIHDFIRENKTHIDAAIRKALNNPHFVLNDSERRLWILNDFGLYTWARQEGVNI